MDRQYYKEYYHLERKHWWFRVRKEIIKLLFEKIISNDKKEKITILNVGAATGATTQMLATYGEVTSVEYDSECCDFLRNNLKIDAINASLTELPFEDEKFDVVCAFDVIEHIKDDKTAVLEIYRVLKKQGYYFITVPAFNFLWSKHDDINHHLRRYNSKKLQELLIKSGFMSKYFSYFNFWLFTPIALIRLLQRLLPKNKSRNHNSGSDFEMMKSSAVLNTFFYWIFASEKYFLKLKIKLPFGISLLNIGSKNDLTTNE